MATAKDVLDYLKDNEKGGNVVRIEPFHGDGTQDPLAWITDFEKAAIANSWSLAKQRKIMPAFLRGNADEWQQTYYPTHAVTADAGVDWAATKAAFIDQFCNQRWKNKWIRDLDELKQLLTKLVKIYYSQYKRIVQ